MTWTGVYHNLLFSAELILAEFLLLAGREPKKKHHRKALLFLLFYTAIALLFSYQVSMKLISGHPQIGMFLRYILLWLLSAGLAFSGWRCSREYLCIVVLCGYIVQHTAYSVQRRLETLRKFFSAYFPYTITLQLGMVVFSAALVYSVLYFLFLKKIKKSASVPDIKTILFLSVGILINVLILDMNISGIGTLPSVLIRLLSIFDCLLVLAVIVKISENQKLQTDVEMIGRLADMKQDYYETLKENITLTNIKCHDFRHQISGLRLRLSESDAVGEALDEMERSIDTYEAISKTGNEDFDVVLTEKSLLCQREGIRFTYMADGDGLKFIRREDLYSLFGNLLDNSIEAVSKLSNPAQKVISLTVRKTDGFLNIQLSNYCTKSLARRPAPDT